MHCDLLRLLLLLLVTMIPTTAPVTGDFCDPSNTSSYSNKCCCSHSMHESVCSYKQTNLLLPWPILLMHETPKLLRHTLISWQPHTAAAAASRSSSSTSGSTTRCCSCRCCCYCRGCGCWDDTVGAAAASSSSGRSWPLGAAVAVTFCIGTL